MIVSLIANLAWRRKSKYAPVHQNQNTSIFVRFRDRLPKFLWQCPIFQPVIHLSYLAELKQSKEVIVRSLQTYSLINDFDSSSDEERKKQSKMIKEAAENHHNAKNRYSQTLSDFQELRLYEVFAESAPQAAMQLSIMLQLGYLTQVQILTISTSLFSVAYGSTNIYLLKPTIHCPFKTKTWQETWLMAFPAMVLIMLPRMISWSIMIAYVKQYTAIVILVFVILSVLFSINYLKKDLHNVLIGTLTNLFSPCIVYDEGSSFYLKSSIIAICNHIVAQTLLFILVMTQILDPGTSKSPPILHCFKLTSGDSRFMISRCPQNSFDYTSNCTSILSFDKDSHDYITLCNTSYVPWYLPLLLVFILLVFSLMVSFLITYYLNAILDPTRRISNHMNCCLPSSFGEEETAVKAVQKFMKRPTKRKLSEINTKLTEETGQDLMSWSIKNGWIEPIKLMLFDLDVVPTKRMIHQASQVEQLRILKYMIIRLCNIPIDEIEEGNDANDLVKAFKILPQKRGKKMPTDIREKCLALIADKNSVKNTDPRDPRAMMIYNLQKDCKTSTREAIEDCKSLDLQETAIIWMSNYNKPDPQISTFKNPMMMSLVREGNLAGLKKLLRFDHTKAKKPPLHEMLTLAVEKGHIDILQYLTQHPDSQPLYGWDLLFLALKKGNVDVITAVLNLPFWNTYALKDNLELSPMQVCGFYGHQEAESVLGAMYDSSPQCLASIGTEAFSFHSKKSPVDDSLVLIYTPDEYNDRLEELNRLHNEAVNCTKEQITDCMTRLSDLDSNLQANLEDSNDLSEHWIDFVILRLIYRAQCLQRMMKQVIISGLVLSKEEIEELLDQAVLNGGFVDLHQRGQSKYL